MSSHGSPDAAARLIQRTSGMPQGIERRSLEDLADRMKPLERPLKATEVACPLGLATRDLAERSFRVGWDQRPPIRIQFTSMVEDIPADAYDISGAWISPWGSVFCDGRLYVDDFRIAAPRWRESGWPMFIPERIGFYGFDPTADTAVFDKDVPTIVADEGPHFLFDVHDGAINFGHFIHDTLSQLMVYDAVAKKLGRKPRPILLQEFRYPIQKVLFERLVGPLGDAVVLNGRAIEVADCHTSSRALRGWEGQVCVAAFRYLRGKLRAAFSGADRKQIYITRADSSKRDIRLFENTALLESRLTRIGFANTRVGDLTPSATIDLFSKAATIVGIHGAGLLNAMFAPDDVHVVELWEHPFSWRSIAMVFAACDIRHTIVKAVPPEEGSGASIDIDGVLALLEA